jgi:hypothetical protein
MFEQLDFVSQPSSDAARDVLIVLAFIFRSLILAASGSRANIQHSAFKPKRRLAPEVLMSIRGKGQWSKIL